MAIQTVSEFEAAISILISRIEKTLAEVGSVAVLETAIRELQAIKKVARTPELKTKQAALEKISDTLAVFIKDDGKTTERFWDLMDYIEYWA